MLIIRAEILKILIRIANREDPDQTASSEAVWSGSALFVKAFLEGNSIGNSIRNFRTFTACLQITFYGSADESP